MKKLLLILVLFMAAPVSAQITMDAGEVDCGDLQGCPGDYFEELDAAKFAIMDVMNCTGYGHTKDPGNCQLLDGQEIVVKLDGANYEDWRFTITEATNAWVLSPHLGGSGGGGNQQKFFIFSTTTCVGSYSEQMAPATFGANDDSYKIGDVNDTAPNPFGFCYTVQHAGGE